MPRKKKSPDEIERLSVERIIYPARPKWIRILDAHRRRFEAGYPLAAWDAFLFARQAKKPVPEWVLAELEKTAERLLKIPEGDPSAHVMAALGIYTTGRGNEFRRTLNEVKRWQAVRRVIELQEEFPERDLTSIYLDVADELGLSNRTIEKWHLSLREAVETT